MIDYKNRVNNLKGIYGLDFGRVTTASVATALEKNHFDSKDDREWVNQIQKIVLSEQMNVLKDEKLQASLLKSSKCTICGREGEIVTLARNRPSFYCPEHRVANPLSLEQIEGLNFKYSPTVGKKD